MNLTGRTVLITGGTRGIGLELARRFLAQGSVVIVTGRDEARLEEAKKKLPGVHAIRCDVSDGADIDNLHSQLMSQFPSMDVIINNAGIMRDLKMVECSSIDDVVREIDVDLSGPIKVIQRFMPHLLTKSDATIINVTSGLAFVPMPMSPVYSAAKAGLRAYTRALRVQLAATGIRVIELAPPATDSDLYRELAGDGPQGVKPMPVDVLVDKAIAGLIGDRLEIVPGMARALRLMGRLAPDFALRQLAKASGY